MAIPPDIKARLEQLRQEAAIRAELDRRRALAQQNTEAMAQPVSPWNPIPLKKAEGGLADDSYRGEHTAPGPHFGAPMHDVTRDMYPKDFYGPNGFRYYADYGEQKDRDAYNKVTRVKGKPDEMVYIHRAIPTKVYNEAMKKDAPLKHMIRPGDWVAINKDYAKEHGDSVLHGDYKVASMRVPAKHVWTNGDSVHEWGYHPVESKATGGSVPSQDVMRLAVGGQGPKNWLKGSVERVIEPLKVTTGVMSPEKVAEQQRSMETARRILGAEKIRLTLEQMEREIQQSHQGNAINQWVERNLANYIKKQMATHEDPIRKLAEQGIVHMPPEQMGYGSSQADMVRKRLKAPRLGQSPEAQAWEDATDVSMHHTAVGDYMNTPREPWMEKADPETKVFRPTDNMHAHYLGFDHLVDVLKQDLAEGRIRPEQLNKVSIEQAVRRAHEYDQERKKAMAETALKATEGMPIHKDYGDGYKWIELAMNPDLPEGWSKAPSGAYVDPQGNQSIHHPNYLKLDDALKYEGDTMGHCVGGYTPDVAAGKSRIFSLRDAKNEPHVTVEVNPHSQRVAPRHDEVVAEMKKSGLDTANMKEADYDAAYEQALQRVKQNRPPGIKQIKGKQNAKPKKDYIPYVQDFVKSGQWSDVDDLQNTDLIRRGNVLTPTEKQGLIDLGHDVPEYLSQEDIARLNQARGQAPVVRKASGGAIQGNSMTPSLAQMKIALASQGDTSYLRNIGINEAIDIDPKIYIPPTQSRSGVPAPGGVATPSGMPIGGVDTNKLTPGQQMMPMPGGPQLPDPSMQGAMPGQQPSPLPSGFNPGSQQQAAPNPIGGGNILQMTPQGRAMAAMSREFPPMPSQTPSNMAKGGSVKIAKINPREWAGTGFGYRGATYGIPTHPHIAIKREPHGWTAIDTNDRSKKWFGIDKNDLENELNKDLFNPTGMAKGGLAKSVDEMKAEMAAKKKAKAAPQTESEGDDDEEPAPSKRITIRAEGPGGVTGIVVPHHMWHGRSWVSKKTGKLVVVPGMKEINKARAEVYGSENRDPLSIGKMGAIHKQTLAEHFSKPLKEQLAAEKAATQKLRAAKHLGSNANTLDESEKLDTVRHETDEEGRTHVGFASKGVAGHALYTSGHGKNEKHHIINTCPGQTEGCGGGKSAEGIVDTSKGTCFAPNAESQYVHAAVRRATHEQAKHDPAMTRDWILAHTGSMREAAKKADKNNQRLLFRPNVVDETDVSSRHVIRHLNEQRKAEGKPPIIANSYGKTNELHDPENGYHVTHSNVGPKVKKGREISENIGRDKARVRNTILAADNKGDFTNEQGHKTPPKGSYMVTDVKRGSKLSKDMEKAITHAKYWSTGRTHDELSDEEKAEGPEAHYNGSGRKTTEDKSHYGHKTVNGLRFDYQRQHVLHPRLVNVPIRKKNKKTGEMETKDHLIPTDSRFKDTDFLPKNRYKTKNGKEAGHILMTTPTESTSNLGHETSFTHHVNQSHVEHALKNKGEYEIDKPEDQIKAKGKEYAAPQPVKFMADGGAVDGRHPGYGADDFHAFPESNLAAQRHLAMRRGDDEGQTQRKLARKVTIHKDLDTMRLALTRK